jgi:hypothetical protein
VSLCWLVAVRFESELFRIPVLIEGTSYLFGVAVSLSPVFCRRWRSVDASAA